MDVKEVRVLANWISTRHWHGARGAVAVMTALGRWLVMDGSGRHVERRGGQWFVVSGDLATGPHATLQSALDHVEPAVGI